MRSSVAVLFGLVLLSASVAMADDGGGIDSFFDVTFLEDFDHGGGTGYDAGGWFYYPNTGWTNQWFYNDLYDPTRWKEIQLDFTINITDPAGWAEIAINWTSDIWPGNGGGPGGTPPLPPLNPADELAWIVRDTVVTFGYTGMEQSLNLELYVIPDYNPEWVSIDVQGQYFTIPDGHMFHDCVPEPATLSLVALGLGALAVRRRRKA
jgi:PEP-CTERM motif